MQTCPASGRNRRGLRRRSAPGEYPERVAKPAAKRVTHLDASGAARMVDVADKPVTSREALAECIVRMAPATLRAVREGTPKGDAVQVARIAGILAAKRTSELIPLCHPLPPAKADVASEFLKDGRAVLHSAPVVR